MKNYQKSKKAANFLYLQRQYPNVKKFKRFEKERRRIK